MLQLHIVLHHSVFGRIFQEGYFGFGAGTAEIHQHDAKINDEYWLPDLNCPSLSLAGYELIQMSYLQREKYLFE